jgi:hypothetical protein
MGIWNSMAAFGYDAPMPAQISHVLAGEAALRLAAPERARLLDEPEMSCAAAWFRLGCQGPDIFYHNQRTKPSGIHYGSLVHRRNYGLLMEGALARYLEARPYYEDRQELSTVLPYLLGFATHAALDRALHPYVVYFASWERPEEAESDRYRGCHPFLERLLDMEFLAELKGLAPAAYDFEALFPLESRSGGSGAAKRNEEDIRDLLASGLEAGYPRAAASDFLLARRIENAFADTRYFLRATNPAKTKGAMADSFAYLDDRVGPKSVAIVYPDEFPENLDVMNHEHRTWFHPSGDGRSSTEGAMDLFSKGVSDATASIKAVLASLEAGRVLPTLASTIGNGSLSIAGLDGIAVAPKISDPLPLHEVLVSEFKHRLDLARRPSDAAAFH